MFSITACVTDKTTVLDLRKVGRQQITHRRKPTVSIASRRKPMVSKRSETDREFLTMQITIKCIMCNIFTTYYYLQNNN